MQTPNTTGVLAGLTAQELDHLLSLGAILHYSAGDVVIREQSSGHEWYIVLRGRVGIELDPEALGALAPGSSAPRQALTLGPGDVGDLAPLNADPPSAAVVALEEDTRLLAITPHAFDSLLDTGHSLAVNLLRNLVRHLTARLSHTQLLLLQQHEADHHIRDLCEQLAADGAMADPLVPLHRTLVLRDREAFVLSELAAHREAAPRKEILDVLVFADPADLHALLDHGEPSGEAIFRGLFSLLRHGCLPSHGPHGRLSYRYAPERGRRAGSLLVNARSADPTFQIDWEVKGWQLDGAAGAARASICLTIVAGAPAEARIDASTMPIQRAVAADLQRDGVSGAGYRVLAVHHRTHEVAQTLQSLRQLGFELDAFVGIPYGEASWATSRMLDRASGHRYLCLQAIPHPAGPTTYRFDSLRSSFLHDDQEREIARLYADPANTGSYRAAMGALLTYLLESAIRTCRARGERLLLYEDGAYLTPLIYAIYHRPEHPLHTLVRAAVDTGLLVGSVEVTTSGERAQAAVIREHGQPLLPVVSGARDDAKLIFEAVGVAEAVIHASSTALGNLGLPAFGFRRVAVLGGNGAIGVRVVEQLAQLQRSVERIFVVDPFVSPFSRPIPADNVPAIAARLAYQHLPRHPITGRQLPQTLRPAGPLDAGWAAQQILAALEHDEAGDEVLLRTSAHLAPQLAAAIWDQVVARGGYEVSARLAPDGGHGWAGMLRRGRAERGLRLLAPETVLVCSSLAPLLRAGIDTVIGVTGTTAFTDEDFEAFLERPCPSGGPDELVLISGSSRDDEFQRAIAQLNRHPGGRQAEGGRGLASFRVRKSIHPDIGSVYHLSRGGAQKRLVLLSDGFAVNLFARHEKGVKTEYMDPIMTMQLLSLVRLTGSQPALPPGLHQARHVLPPGQLKAFWDTLNARCAPPALSMPIRVEERVPSGG